MILSLPVQFDVEFVCWHKHILRCFIYLSQFCVHSEKKSINYHFEKKNAEEKNLKNWNKITKSGKKERDGIAKKIWKDREKNWKFQRKVNKKTRNEWIRLRINWYWSVECIRFHAKCTTSIWFDFGFVFVLDDNLYVVFNDDENILDKKMKKIV